MRSNNNIGESRKHSIAQRYSNHYDYKVILGDFNLKPIDSIMMTCLNKPDSINLRENDTSFKEGLCIDLILTNRNVLFENSTSFETRFML